LEAGAGELDADQVLAGLLRVGYVDYAAAGGEILVRLLHASGAARSVARERNANFQVGANGHVEAGDEGGAVAAKIFAGSFFFEGDAAGVAARTLSGKRTEILRSERCFDTERSAGTMGWVLISGDPD